MNGQLEVGELHPDACGEGWWFGIDAEADAPEFRIPDLGHVQGREARPRPTIYICKDKKVVFVAETLTLTLTQEFLGFAEALAAINQTWP